MKGRDQKIIWCVLISLLLHLLFIKWLGVTPRTTESAVTELELRLLKKKQIADIVPPRYSERPEQADFLGLYDSKVKEETVAVTPPQASPPPGKPQTTPSSERDASRYALAHPQFQYKKDTAPSGQEGWRIEDNLPEDYFPNYKLGPHTYLNVQRYPQITYFVRLKKIFRTTFDPVPALRQSFTLNQVSRGHVEVLLGVEVGRQGELQKVFVITSSGLAAYDREALRTIRDSAPFAAPPIELLAPDGSLRMTWAFTVYL